MTDARIASLALGTALPLALLTLACASNPESVATTDASPKTGSIAGRISQPDSTPETGAHVVAAIRERDGTLTTIGAVMATWDGRYEITDLPAGEYLVLAEPDPNGTVERLNRHVAPPVATLYPGVPVGQPGQTVRVLEGVATEGIDIWLTPGAQHYSVSGRVTWPDGVTVDTITLEYGGLRLSGLEPGGVENGIWEVYDPGGLFTIDALPAGTLVILARAESSAGPLAGIVATEVGPSSVEEVRLPLGRPGSMEGRVVFTETPINPPGPVRLVHSLLDVSALYSSEESRIAPDGRFSIPRALGTYTVEVDNLPPGWRVVSLSRGQRRLPRAQISVGTGEAISGLDVMVAPGDR